MRFGKRQYILIALILILGIFNYVRMKRLQPPPPPPAPPPVARATSPLWTLFDNTAAVRDATDDQFQPALKTLNQGIDSATPAPDLGDLHGCQTWLLFYRQEHLHPAVNKPGWAAQLQSHVNSCVANHRDISQ